MRVSARSDHSKRGRASAPHAFTLLEVILASALAATMLIGLWSLLNMQTRLFARAPVKIEQCQLVRALYQQFADDLHTSIFTPEEDPAKVTRSLGGGSPRPPSGGSVTAAGVAETLPQTSASTTATVISDGAGRPSALIGSGQSLHLQVLQVPLPQTGTSPDETDQPIDVTADDAGSRVPELRDVAYTFYPPGVIGVDSQTYQAGLVRREVAWDTVDDQTGTASVPWIFRPESTDQLASEVASGVGPSGAPAETTPRHELVTYVPEVAGMEFRYFDGTSWSSSWDSHQRHAMPVAVEVLIDFGDAQSAQASSDAAMPTAESDLPARADQRPTAMAEPSDLTTGEQPALNPNIYRFVVFLPSGAQRSTSEVSADGGIAP